MIVLEAAAAGAEPKAEAEEEKDEECHKRVPLGY